MTHRFLGALLCAVFALGLDLGLAASEASARGASASRGCLTSAARALLGRIEAKFGRVHVISTCRPGARIAGTGRISRHASGNAVDFNAPAGKKGVILRWLIANHKRGGTMTYAGMSHIHVDIGQHFVSVGSSRRGGYRKRRSTRIAGGLSRRPAAWSKSSVGAYQERKFDAERGTRD